MVCVCELRLVMGEQRVVSQVAARVVAHSSQRFVACHVIDCARIGFTRSHAPTLPPLPRFNIGKALATLEDHDTAQRFMWQAMRRQNRVQLAHARTHDAALMQQHWVPRPTGTGARTVAIFTYEYGQSWWPQWGPRSLDTGGVGGSEEACILMARALARKGCVCGVVCRCWVLHGLRCVCCGLYVLCVLCFGVCVCVGRCVCV